MSLGRKLKVGLLLDSFEIPAWAFLMLEKIQAAESSEICLIVLNKPIQKSKFQKFWSNKNKLIYFAYSYLDNIIFNCKPDAFEKKDTRSFLKNIPVIRVNPKRKKYSDYISKDDIAQIKEHDIDIFIRLGFRILRGKILKVPRFGVWSYHHGDNKINRGGPAGFWEVFENHAQTGSILQILKEDLDNGLVLQRSYSLTDYYSVKKNRNNFYWKSLSFIPRKLDELYLTGEEVFFEKVKKENQGFECYKNRLYSIPKNREMSKLLCKKLCQIFYRLIHKLFFIKQWFLLCSLQEKKSFSFFRYKKILPPKDRCWADPHVITKDDKFYIFIEEVLYRTGKGHISVIEMDKKGICQKPVKIIEKPYHLSYPFIFEWESKFFMVPESKQNKTVELYECVKFPYEWKFKKNIMENIKAVDATPFYYQNKWWLFMNIIENNGASSLDELFLFYSDDIFNDQWTPHPKNPIATDVRSARPSGKIFKRGGKIIRPSQNCAHRYGYGLKFNEIIKLNETEYEEMEIGSVEPNWNNKIIATHTFNSVNGLTVADAMIIRPRIG